MRSGFRTLLAVISLLVIGAVAGVGGDRLVQSHHGGPRVVDGRFVGDPITLMHEELNLTAAQRETIREIFARRQPEIDAAWHAARTQVQATVDSVIAEVAAQLDETQQTRFYELVERVHSGHGVPLHHGR